MCSINQVRGHYPKTTKTYRARISFAGLISGSAIDSNPAYSLIFLYASF